MTDHKRIEEIRQQWTGIAGWEAGHVGSPLAAAGQDIRDLLAELDALVDDLAKKEERIIDIVTFSLMQLDEDLAHATAEWQHEHTCTKVWREYALAFIEWVGPKLPECIATTYPNSRVAIAKGAADQIARAVWHPTYLENQDAPQMLKNDICLCGHPRSLHTRPGGFKEQLACTGWRNKDAPSDDRTNGYPCRCDHFELPDATADKEEET